jgi:hypothetical protein
LLDFEPESRKLAPPKIVFTILLATAMRQCALMLLAAFALVLLRLLRMMAALSTVF